MLKDVLVESRSYDQVLRGSWNGYRLDADTKLSDSYTPELSDDCVLIWLPAGTPMRWTTGVRPLRNNCLQFFWPRRWYMLSAFYQERTLMHTYANIIPPATMQINRISYVDLDLSILVKPDMTYEVLTQAEFEHTAEMLRYSEETRIGALMAQRTLTSVMQRTVGLFANIPSRLSQVDFHLAHCADK